MCDAVDGIAFPNGIGPKDAGIIGRMVVSLFDAISFKRDALSFPAYNDGYAKGRREFGAGPGAKFGFCLCIRHCVSLLSFLSIHPEQRMLLWWCVEKVKGSAYALPFLISNGFGNLGKPVFGRGQPEVCRYAVVEGRVLGETHVNEPEVVAVLHDVQ